MTNTTTGMKEIWKDIDGYEGLYQVSTLGRVRSLPRDVIRGRSYKCVTHNEMKILEPFIMGGYCNVNLYKDGKAKMWRVHRLVAFAFIPNPNGYPIINHKDEDKTNNRVDNIEWCTHSYNNTYGSHYERSRVAKFKPIEQYTKDGKLVARYGSLLEAHEKTGIQASNISKVAKGGVYGFNSAGGYVWRFAK